MGLINLSKSSFIRGLQCHKSLYLYKTQPQLQDKPDPTLQQIFDTGTSVGELATQLFPGGVQLPFEELDYAAQIAETARLMEAGATAIYEATFSEDETYVRVDILKRGETGWEIYEVKSSSKVKEVYEHDLAVQYYVLKKAGLKISKACLVHIDTGYVRQGDIDLTKLFATQDLTDKVAALRPFVEAELKKMKAMLGRESAPQIPLGPHCSNPYRCSFWGHCYKDLPLPSVFDLSGGGRPDPYDYYHRGFVGYEELPVAELPEKKRFQVESFLQQKNHVDKQGVQEFLDELWYPIAYLDFETTQLVSVPLFDGTRPFEQLPFQYSLHIQTEPGGEVEHREYLAEPGIDPRTGLVERLIADVPADACILVYNKAFETRNLKQLCQFSPKRKTELLSMVDRVRDLMLPFQQRHVYYWQTNGSYSLKAVLPALVPELSYQDLAISNGSLASAAYLEMGKIQDAEELAALRKNMLAYCELDTWAMVKLLEKLVSISNHS